MTETVHIFEELIYTTPECDDILPFKENPKEQRWVRPDVNRELSEDEIQLEFKRRKEGVCFMNNGFKTYITGNHYFFLTYCRFSFGYPSYRDVDRRFFFAWQIVVDDKYCLGLIRAKMRRTGATSQGEALILNIGSMTYGVQLGIVSQNLAKAAKVFRGIVDVMQRIPEVFIPALESRDRPKKEISFREPAKVMGGKKKERSKLSLNTTIDFQSTTINSYDGEELYFLLVDEAAKWTKETPFGEFFEIHKTCLIQGGEIFGKMYIPSTINELEKGGFEFKGVWEDSSPYLKNEKGQNILELTGATSSGLKRLFLSAEDGLQGFVGYYGESIIETPTQEQIELMPKSVFAELKMGSKEYLQQQIDKISNPNKKAERKRQFPTNVREAFSLNNKLSPFDTNKLTQQTEFNEDNPNLVTRGDLVWIEKWRSVQWIPSENGRFLTSWIPPVEQRNRFEMRNGLMSPAFESEGHFGLDPFSHDTVTDNRRSNAALYGIKKATPATPEPFFFLEYVFRPPTVEGVTEDVAKACIFYGMPVLGESNKPEVMNRLKSQKLYHYLMLRPFENSQDYHNNMRKPVELREYWLPNTGGQNSPVRGVLVDRMQSFVYNHVGNNDETGYMGKCYFNTLLSDLMLFDPEESWTPFDSFVGAAYAITGLYKFVPKVTTQPFIPQIPYYKRKSHPFR